MIAAKTEPDDTPSVASRTTIVIVIVAVVAALAALAVWMTRADPATPLPTVPSVPAAALPDGEMFGFVTGVGEGAITVDPALMLDGQVARAAATADGAIEAGEDLPNDFYIHNTQPGPVEMVVADDLELTVLGFDAAGGITPTAMALADLAVAFTGNSPGVAIYGLVAGEFPVTFVVEDGTVVEIEQFYLP